MSPCETPTGEEVKTLYHFRKYLPEETAFFLDLPYTFSRFVSMTLSMCKTVLLAAPHLDFGGSAQVLRLLARGLSRQRFDLHLVLTSPTNADRAITIEGLQIHSLQAGRVRRSLPKLAALTRRIQPDVLFSTMAHLNLAILFMRQLIPAKTAIVVRQNSMLAPCFEAGDYSCREEILFRWLYPRADRIVCQSAAMAKEMTEFARLREERIAVLPNPIDEGSIRTAASQRVYAWNGPGPHLVAMGRLSQEKGFDLLLTTIALLRNHFPNLELAIAGQGSLEGELRAQCMSLGLNGAVRFCGQLENPFPLLASATAFVLSSRRDAMPNALLEAASLGLPIVATPASSGLEQLLAHRPGVWLAQQASCAALSASLLAALEALPAGQRYEHDFLKEFQYGCVLSAYEDLLDAAIATRRK